MRLFSSADFSLKTLFSRYSFRDTIKVPDGLDLDQDKRSDGPDLDLNSL